MEKAYIQLLLLHHNLLLFSAIYLFSSQLLHIMIFSSKKAKIAKVVLNKNALVAGTPGTAVFTLQFL